MDLAEDLRQRTRPRLARPCARARRDRRDAARPPRGLRLRPPRGGQSRGVDRDSRAAAPVRPGARDLGRRPDASTASSTARTSRRRSRSRCCSTRSSCTDGEPCSGALRPRLDRSSRRRSSCTRSPGRCSPCSSRCAARCSPQQRSARWQVGSLCLVGGFVLGGLWPAYSLGAALGETRRERLDARHRAARSSSLAARALPRLRLPSLARARPARAARGARRGRRRRARLVWECSCSRSSHHDPLLHSNHLSLYWVEDRWRWPLMFAAGAVGLAGLVRLAQRGKPLAAALVRRAASRSASSGAGRNGAAALVALPAVLPGAAGARDGARARGGEAGAARTLVITTFVLVAAFKLVTLTELSPRIRYFGTPLQELVHARLGGAARRRARRDRSVHELLRPGHDRPPRARRDEGARRPRRTS